MAKCLILSGFRSFKHESAKAFIRNRVTIDLSSLDDCLPAGGQTCADEITHLITDSMLPSLLFKHS
jgi:hypothetical protein